VRLFRILPVTAEFTSRPVPFSGLVSLQYFMRVKDLEGHDEIGKAGSDTKLV
jgi:hypothetical protein